MFDAERPVFIKSGFVDDKGNYFPPDPSRPYRLKTIPAKYRTSDHLSQGVLKKVVTESDMARAIGLSGDKSSKGKNLSAQNTKILESKEVNINTASKGELEALEGVGPATAATIVKIREDKPFTSVSDLNERVALPRSAKWDSLKSVISFDG